ncbi:MAG: hypothetical protein QOG80_2450, partial [Pseudonocardiales bacterium]|nr:hypothetical protein [Pseudonocardiales bacterium]
MSRIARLVAIMIVGGAICLAAPAAVSAHSAGPGNSLPKSPSKHTTPAAPSTHTKPTKVNNPKTPAKPHARARHRAESTGPSRAEHRVQTSRGAHPRTGRAAGTTASNAVTKNAAKRAVSTAQPSTAVLNPAVIRAVLTGRTTSGVATQSQSRWVRIASQRSGNPS